MAARSDNGSQIHVERQHAQDLKSPHGPSAWFGHGLRGPQTHGENLKGSPEPWIKGYSSNVLRIPDADLGAIYSRASVSKLQCQAVVQGVCMTGNQEARRHGLVRAPWNVLLGFDYAS